MLRNYVERCECAQRYAVEQSAISFNERSRLKRELKDLQESLKFTKDALTAHYLAKKNGTYIGMMNREEKKRSLSAVKELEARISKLNQKIIGED